jgi:integrase
MRCGELLGLRWEDIDLEGHRIFVRRPLWRGKFVIPNSRRSRRLAPTLRTALARLPSRFQGGLVLCNSDGTPLDPDNFAHRDWARAPAPPHPVPRPAPHVREPPDRAGARLKYIQAQLGHALIQTTLDRYGHLMPDAQVQVARSVTQTVAETTKGSARTLANPSLVHGWGAGANAPQTTPREVALFGRRVLGLFGSGWEPLRG